MTIRAKTLLSLAITMVALTVVLYFALCRIVSGGFAVVENGAAEKNIERVRETFASDLEALCSKTGDWAIWDDAYQFVQDGNKEFVESNIAPSAMSSMNLALLAFFDAKGEIVSSTSYYPKEDKLVPVPPAILAEHFSKTSDLVRHAKADGQKAGILFTPGSLPLVFCSRAIVPTSGEGVPRGAVVFAKPFDAGARAALMRTTKLKLAFGEEGAAGTPEPIAAQLGKMSANRARYIDDSDPKTLVGYTRFQDFYGKKSLIARIDMPREVLEQAQASYQYLAISLLVFGLAFVVVTVLLVENSVLRRLAKMSTDVTRITESFDFESRLDDKSRDELGRLGLAVNRLLAAVAQIQHAKLSGRAGASAPPEAPGAPAAETEGDHG